MKKRFYMFNAFIVLLLFALTFLGPKPPLSAAPTTTTAPAAATTSTAPETTAKSFPLPGWPKSFAISHIGTVGKAYVMTVGLCSMINKNLKITATPTLAKGSREAAELFYSNTIDWGTVSPPTNYQVFRGIEDFKGRGTVPARVVGPAGGVTNINFMTWKGSGIKSAADLKGKKVMYLSYASPLTIEMTELILEANGVSPKDVKGISFTDFTEIWDSLREKNIDAAFNIRRHPNADIIELTKTHDIEFLSISEKDVAYISQRKSYYTQDWLKAGTYRGMEKDVRMLGAQQSYLISLRTPDSLAYEIINLIYGQTRKEWLAIHAGAGEDFPPLDKTISSHLSIGPYHPGIIKYYKEKGVWTLENDAANAKFLKESGASR